MSEKDCYRFIKNLSLKNYISHMAAVTAFLIKEHGAEHGMELFEKYRLKVQGV